MSLDEFLARREQERLFCEGQKKEKAAMIEAMHCRLAVLPSHFSLEDYIALCEEVGTSSGSSFPRSEGHDLFRQLAVIALPRIFPDIHPVHFSADINSHALTLVDPQGANHLPEQIHGVATQEFLNAIAKGIPIPKEPKKRADRIGVAKGMCTTFSERGLRQLVTTYEQFSPFAFMRGVSQAFRHTKPGDGWYPNRLAPLGYAHGIISLPYAGTNGPRELLIDPIVAEVDWTQSYDIEVTSVPASKVPNFLRLRYSSFPDSKVSFTQKTWL